MMMCSPLKVTRRFGEAHRFNRWQAEQLGTCFNTGFLFGLLFHVEDGSDAFLWNFG
jgi:hypothetical protein